MLNSTLLDDIIRKLGNALPPDVSGLKKDLEKNFRSILQNAFAKLDLVTREEFDVQTKVLARTRAKLDVLEVQLDELEKKLKTKEKSKKK
jgi:ubiquinone biosynthesis accessory factor UbiK